MAKNVLVNCMARRMSIELYSYEMTKGLLQYNQNVSAVVPESIENLEEWKKLPLKRLYVIKTYTNLKELIVESVRLILGGYNELKKMFREEEFDIIYAPFLNLWTGIINSLFPKSKILITLHDPIPHSGENCIRSFIDTYNVQKADGIILLSERFKEFTNERYKVALSNIITLPLGSYRYKKYENGITYQYPGKVNYLFFGRIEKYKGLHILAKAYEELTTKVDDVSLTIVGNGDFSDYIDEYEKLKNVTVFNRWIEDSEVPYFFGGENVISVLPYIDATQSGVVPIAFEFETPIIGTKTGGLEEQIEDGVTGILVSASNSHEICNAMELLYRDKKFRENLANNGREKLKDWDWKELGRKLYQYIESFPD